MKLYLNDLLELTKVSKEINLNLIAPEGTPAKEHLYTASVEQPDKEEQILAKKPRFKINS